MARIGERRLGAASLDRWIRVLAGLLAALLAGVAAVSLPIGRGEVAVLAAIQDMAAPGAAWSPLWPADVAYGLPGFNLLFGAGVARFGPAADTSVVWLRLPDVFALIGLVCLGGASDSRRTPGSLIAAGLVASPLVWLAPASVPGLGVAAFAVSLLYFALVQMAPARWPARLAAAAAIGLLLVNGAGLAATAVVAGVWLHRGLSVREWRLFASRRITILAVLVLAGLTLTDRFGLPSASTLHANLAGVGTLLGATPRLAGWAGLAVFGAGGAGALVAGVLDRRATGGRCGLIVVCGFALLVTAIRPAPLIFIALAPLGVMLLAAPVGVAGRIGATASAALAAIAVLAVSGVGAWILVPLPDAGRVAAWGALAGAVLLVGAAIASLWREGTRAGTGRAAALLWLAVALMAFAWLAQPLRLVPQRLYDQELAKAAAPWQQRSIAVLAPVSARYWRIALERPLYRATSLDALCRWAADAARRGRPVVLLRPKDVPAATSRLGAFDALLQSPGTAQTSIIAARFEPCERPRQ